VSAGVSAAGAVTSAAGAIGKFKTVGCVVMSSASVFACAALLPVSTVALKEVHAIADISGIVSARRRGVISTSAFSALSFVTAAGAAATNVAVRFDFSAASWGP